MNLFLDNVGQVNPGAVVMELSAETGEGMEPWVDWLAGVADCS